MEISQRISENSQRHKKSKLSCAGGWVGRWVTRQLLVTRKGYRGLKSKGHSGTVSMVFGFSSLPSVTFKKKKEGQLTTREQSTHLKKKRKVKKNWGANEIQDPVVNKSGVLSTVLVLHQIPNSLLDDPFPSFGIILWTHLHLFFVY